MTPMNLTVHQNVNRYTTWQVLGAGERLGKGEGEVTDRETGGKSEALSLGVEWSETRPTHTRPHRRTQ